MPTPVECRISPRLGVPPNRSALWIAQPTGEPRVPATRLDISREGALSAADEAPPFYEPSLIRMEEPARTDWVAAIAVRYGGSNRVGIRFVDPCPDDFLLAALPGIDLVPTVLGGPRPESADDSGE